MNNKNEDDFQAEEFPLRIEPGVYDAICYKATYAKCWGGEKKLYLRFRIINHARYEGIELFMACTKPKKKFTYRYKLYKQWSRAIGRTPKKGERFNRDIFLNRLFKINVIVTKVKDEQGKLLPDYLQYSVVNSIVEPLTGEGSI